MKQKAQSCSCPVAKLQTAYQLWPPKSQLSHFSSDTASIAVLQCRCAYAMTVQQTAADPIQRCVVYGCIDTAGSTFEAAEVMP